MLSIHRLRITHYCGATKALDELDSCTKGYFGQRVAYFKWLHVLWQVLSLCFELIRVRGSLLFREKCAEDIYWDKLGVTNTYSYILCICQYIDTDFH